MQKLDERPSPFATFILHVNVKLYLLTRYFVMTWLQVVMADSRIFGGIFKCRDRL